MANIKVMHKCAVISTDLTIKEIKRAGALSPDALSIVDGEGNAVFTVATGSVESITKYGVVFANDSKISVLIESKKVDKELIEETFGAILLQLSKVEAQVMEALEDVETDLEDLIEFVETEEEEEDYLGEED